MFDDVVDDVSFKINNNTKANNNHITTAYTDTHNNINKNKTIYNNTNTNININDTKAYNNTNKNYDTDTYTNDAKYNASTIINAHK